MRMLKRMLPNHPRMMQTLLIQIIVLLGTRALGQEPRFNLVTKNVTVVAGQTAVLPCSVDYLGSYKIVWQSPRDKTLTLEDRRIISDERISLERPYVKEWNLHVRKVKPSDAGTYQCQINTDPVQVRPVMLHVHEPSSIIDHLSSTLQVEVREGETVELVCNVTGFPTPSVTWYRKHTGLLEDDGDTGKKRVGMEGEVLVIHNVSRYCDDIYECVAYNGVSPAATREIHVSVEFPPEVRLPNKKMSQTLGKSTILECEVTAHPLSGSVWRRDGKDVVRSAKYSTELYSDAGNKVTLSLKVQSVTPEDFGEYECYAQNKLGYDSETMILYEYQKPEEKTTTTVTTTTHSLWLSNGNQGHYGNGENQLKVDSHPEDDQSHRSSVGNRAEHPRSSNGQASDTDSYSPYNKLRNPEYSYEPDPESGPVISDPEGEKNRALQQAGSTFCLVFALFLGTIVYGIR